MASQRTRHALRPSGIQHSTHVEVVGPAETPVPAWAATWCSQAGTGLLRGVTLPGSAFTPGRSLDRWSQVMADIGGATGSGVAVLVNRPGRTASIMSCVVAAVHELPDDIEVLLNAAACARALAGTLLLVHAVPLSFAERSVGLDAALARGRATLGTGTQILARTGPSVPATTRLLRAHPHELICQVVEADLVVVGGAPIGSSTTLGLVTASAILHATCPVLVVPRLPGLQQ